MALDAKEEEKASHSYFNPKQNFIKKIPLSWLEHTGITPQQGMILKFNISNGTLRGIVVSLDENNIFLDINPANLI